MATTLGALNPIRYRGYVYDTETGLYYLQSRYYDPEIARFLNGDAYVSTGQGMLGNNIFAYCRNNPVYRIDIAGTTDECNKDSLDDNNQLNDLGNPTHNGSGGPSHSVGSANGPLNKIGTDHAPQKAPSGTTYTRVTNDGQNTVRSETVYGEYDLPIYRIDYDHNHGPLIGPHIHYFYPYVGPNGIFQNKGPILSWEII